MRRERINKLRNRVCGVGDVRMRGSQRTGWALGRKRDFDAREDDADVVVSKHRPERCSLATCFVEKVQLESGVSECGGVLALPRLKLPLAVS